MQTTSIWNAASWTQLQVVAAAASAVLCCDWLSAHRFVRAQADGRIVVWPVGERRPAKSVSFTASQVLPSFTRFYWVLLGFNWVLLGFTGFYRVLPGFNWALLAFLGVTGCYWVLPSLTGFHWVSLGFTEFFWFSLGFPRFS